MMDYIYLTHPILTHCKDKIKIKQRHMGIKVTPVLCSSDVIMLGRISVHSGYSWSVLLYEIEVIVLKREYKKRIHYAFEDEIEKPFLVITICHHSASHVMLKRRISGYISSILPSY